MSVSIHCPTCGRSLLVEPDMVGRRGQCPGCGEVFVIAAPSAASLRDGVRFVDPPPNAGTAPRRSTIDHWVLPRLGTPVPNVPTIVSPWGHGSAPVLVNESGWQATRRGLTTVYTGFCLLVGAGVGAAVWAFIGAGLPEAVPGGADILQFGLAVVGFTALAGLLCIFIGQCMCCRVPTTSGARGFAVGAVVCWVLLCVPILPVPAGVILFGMFLRASASALGRVDVADLARRYLWTVGLEFALLVASVCCAAGGAELSVGTSDGPRYPTMGPLVMCIAYAALVAAALTALVLVITFSRLVRSLRDAMDEAGNAAAYPVVPDPRFGGPPPTFR